MARKGWIANEGSGLTDIEKSYLRCLDFFCPYIQTELKLIQDWLSVVVWR